MFRKSGTSQKLMFCQNWIHLCFLDIFYFKNFSQDYDSSTSAQIWNYWSRNFWQPKALYMVPLGCDDSLMRKYQPKMLSGKWGKFSTPNNARNTVITAPDAPCILKCEDLLKSWILKCFWGFFKGRKKIFRMLNSARKSSVQPALFLRYIFFANVFSAALPGVPE